MQKVHPCTLTLMHTYGGLMLPACLSFSHKHTFDRCSLHSMSRSRRSWYPTPLRRLSQICNELVRVCVSVQWMVRGGHGTNVCVGSWARWRLAAPANRQRRRRTTTQFGEKVATARATHGRSVVVVVAVAVASRAYLSSLAFPPSPCRVVKMMVVVVVVYFDLFESGAVRCIAPSPFNVPSPNVSARAGLPWARAIARFFLSVLFLDDLFFVLHLSFRFRRAIFLVALFFRAGCYPRSWCAPCVISTYRPALPSPPCRVVCRACILVCAVF